MIKSPLRYPGGKSRAIPQIIKYLPANFSEYREPFVGGGSFFIYLKQNYPKLNIWINDLNQNLFLFWKYSQIIRFRVRIFNPVQQIWILL